MSSNEVEKYTYTFIKNEKYKNYNCAVVEQDPVDPKSGYKRRLVWYNLDKNYRLEKIEFYDRKNAKLKSLTYSGYKLYLGKHWRAGKFKMVNHQTGKETELFFENYAFKTGLNEKSFTQNALIRAGR
ncbi:MAG: outer membrane lipoprotein-sorting protein [Bacteroidota bacterium]